MHATNLLSGPCPHLAIPVPVHEGPSIMLAVEYQRRSYYCTLSIRWAAGAVACLVELNAGRVSCHKVLPIVLIDTLAHGLFQYTRTPNVLIARLVPLILATLSCQPVALALRTESH